MSNNSDSENREPSRKPPRRADSGRSGKKRTLPTSSSSSSIAESDDTTDHLESPSFATAVKFTSYVRPAVSNVDVVLIGCIDESNRSSFEELAFARPQFLQLSQCSAYAIEFTVSKTLFQLNQSLLILTNFVCKKLRAHVPEFGRRPYVLVTNSVMGSWLIKQLVFSRASLGVHLPLAVAFPGTVPSSGQLWPSVFNTASPGTDEIIEMYRFLGGPEPAAVSAVATPYASTSANSSRNAPDPDSSALSDMSDMSAVYSERESAPISSQLRAAAAHESLTLRFKWTVWRQLRAIFGDMGPVPLSKDPCLWSLIAAAQLERLLQVEFDSGGEQLSKTKLPEWIPLEIVEEKLAALSGSLRSSSAASTPPVSIGPGPSSSQSSSSWRIELDFRLQHFPPVVRLSRSPRADEQVFPVSINLALSIKQVLRAMRTELAVGKTSFCRLFQTGAVKLTVVGHSRLLALANVYIAYFLNGEPSQSLPSGISLLVNDALEMQLDGASLISNLQELERPSDVAHNLTRYLKKIRFPLYQGLDHRFDDDEVDLDLLRAQLDFVSKPPNPMKIAFLGAPSSGKSTLVNSLLQENVSYTALRESTGAPTEFCSGDELLLQGADSSPLLDGGSPRGDKSTFAMTKPHKEVLAPHSEALTQGEPASHSPTTEEGASNSSSRSRKSHLMKKQVSLPSLMGAASIRRQPSNRGGVNATPSSSRIAAEGHPTPMLNPSTSSSTNQPPHALTQRAKSGARVTPSRSSSSTSPSDPSANPSAAAAASVLVPDTAVGVAAHVILCNWSEFRTVVDPLEREIDALASEITQLSAQVQQEQHQTIIVPAGVVSESQLLLTRLQATREQYVVKKAALEALFHQYVGGKRKKGSRRVVKLSTVSEALPYVKLDGAGPQSASLADIVASVKIFLPHNRLLRYIHLIDTPGLSKDATAFGNDHRNQKSQRAVSDIDGWIFLTSAYDYSDSVAESLASIRRAARPHVPGLVALTHVDNPKSESSSGLTACLRQKQANLLRFAEARDAPVLACKVYADFQSILSIKKQLSQSATPAQRNDAKKKWLNFLTYLNRVFMFEVAEEVDASEIDIDDDLDASSTDAGDDLFALDAASPREPQQPKRLELFVQTFKGATDTDALFADLCSDVSGLSGLYSRLNQIIHARSKRELAQRYSRLEQVYLSVAAQMLRNSIDAQYRLQQVQNSQQEYALVKQNKEQLLLDISSVSNAMDVFRRSLANTRVRLERTLETTLQLILATTDLSQMLRVLHSKRRRQSDKRRRLEGFFASRDVISLREFDNHALRAVEVTVSKCLQQIAASHLKQFGQFDMPTCSKFDYSKLNDEQYWLEEAMLPRPPEHSVEFRGSKKDSKAIADWLARTADSCTVILKRIIASAMSHYDKYSTDLQLEQQSLVRAFVARLDTDIARLEKELKRIESRSLDERQQQLLMSKTRKKLQRCSILLDQHLESVAVHTHK